MPPAAMPFVIEELENGDNPFVVAAAAKALRGAQAVDEPVAALLLDAIRRLRGSDDVVCFDPGGRSAPDAAPTTALMELLRTLSWLGPSAHDANAPLRAMCDERPAVFSAEVRGEIERTLVAISAGTEIRPSCCAAKPTPMAALSTPDSVAADAEIRSTEFEDQDGSIVTFADFFLGRPSVLTFFYSRCMNPNKCSLTITRLASLQKMIGDDGQADHFNVAAITYDPAFDIASRLRSYGAARGMSFDPRNRLLRTTGSFEPIRRWLSLGVGYGGATVNQHRLDMVVLDGDGCPCSGLARSQWKEAEVLSALKAMPHGRADTART
jgi:protein SCO1/2